MDWVLFSIIAVIILAFVAGAYYYYRRYTSFQNTVRRQQEAYFGKGGLPAYLGEIDRNPTMQKKWE